MQKMLALGKHMTLSGFFSVPVTQGIDLILIHFPACLADWIIGIYLIRKKMNW